MRRLCDAGAWPAATVATIRAYGSESLGFLMVHHRDEADADEVFSLWSERLLRGLPGFLWGASLRTWAYTVARHSSMNYLRGKQARGRHEQLGRSEELVAAVHQVRTGTPMFLRTAARDKLSAIRDALPPDDRMLLVLRVDRGLEWKELANVMLGEDEQHTDAALAKESQRLRKRFQLLKDRLVAAGRREGLLDQD